MRLRKKDHNPIEAFQYLENPETADKMLFSDGVKRRVYCVNEGIRRDLRDTDYVVNVEGGAAYVLTESWVKDNYEKV